MTPTIFTSWTGAGWADIVDVLDRIYPAVRDSRGSSDPNCHENYGNCPVNNARQPGCRQGSGTNPPTEIDCPGGQAFWSHVDFTVAYGNGGAISAVGSGPVEVVSSTFVDNRAGQGQTMSIVSAYEITVTNTTFVGEQIED